MATPQTTDTPLGTRRVLLAGTVVLIAAAWALQRIELIYGGAEVGMGALAALPILLLAALAGIRQHIPDRLRPSAGELVALYLMTAIGLPLAGRGFVHYLLPALTTGFYGGFADPAGRYQRFHQYIPTWMVVRGDGATGFFEGGVGVPWAVWWTPLLVWGLLAAGLFAALWGVARLLRHRWLEEERLRLPLADLPSALATDGVVLLKDRRLWAGAAVPILLYGINGIDHHFLLPGAIPTWFDFTDVLIEDPWRAMAPYTSRFRFSVSPLLVGISYLMAVEVSFSTWFFFLATRLQLVFVDLMGRTGDQGVFIGVGGQWREWPNFLPHLQAQSRGGVLCLALLSLWAARRSLHRSWRQAWRSWGQPRLSWMALLAGTATLVLWAWLAGGSLTVSAGHGVLLLLTVIGVARLRVDGGLPVVGAWLLIPNLFFFVAGTGPGPFAPATYVVLAFLTLLTYSSITMWLPLHLEGERLARECGSTGVGVVLAVGAAVGLVAGAVFTLELVYERGIFALDQNGGARSMARLGRYVQYLYAESGAQKAGMDSDRLDAVGFGALATAALATLRQWVLRSPFHPAGFVYATGLGGLLWGSALVGWGVKVLVVRYGGAGTYRALRPFFFGLILGELSMRMLWAGLAPLGDPGSGYDW
ncbi:MAG TPA: hypothetical protein DIC52_12165 [Candidatus Latescibacteria bacterium]|nr:hypothetical protein [Candidatus Latescibacterota bacterium]